MTTLLHSVVSGGNALLDALSESVHDVVGEVLACGGAPAAEAHA